MIRYVENNMCSCAFSRLLSFQVIQSISCPCRQTANETQKMDVGEALGNSCVSALGFWRDIYGKYRLILVGGWTIHLKNMFFSQIGSSFPQGSGWKFRKCLSYHHHHHHHHHHLVLGVLISWIDWELHFFGGRTVHWGFFIFTIKCEPNDWVALRTKWLGRCSARPRPSRSTQNCLTVRPWKIAIPKGNYSLPTIHFQGRTVSLREGTVIISKYGPGFRVLEIWNSFLLISCTRMAHHFLDHPAKIRSLVEETTSWLTIL